MVSVGLPADAGLAAVMWRLGVGLTFALVALLCAFGIAWMLSRRIVRPLRQLGEDASALAAGDLSHRTRVQAHGEVGVLAASFNQMAAALQQREEDAGRAANDLKQAKDTLSAVIDASPVAIVCSDPDRRIFLWNPRRRAHLRLHRRRKPSASTRGRCRRRPASESGRPGEARA